MDFDFDTVSGLRKSLGRRCVESLFVNPLVTYLLGVAVLLTGSVVCEWLMATYGRDAPQYLSSMFVTMGVGLWLWFGFYTRSIDTHDYEIGRVLSKACDVARPESFRGYKLPWTLAFIVASIGCTCLLALVWLFEEKYIQADPADFVWSFDMVLNTLARFPGLVVTFVTSTIFVVMFSVHALRDDRLRDRLKLLDDLVAAGLLDPADLISAAEASQNKKRLE